MIPRTIVQADRVKISETFSFCFIFNLPRTDIMLKAHDLRVDQKGI